MYKFSVTDLTGVVIYEMRYFPDQEPQFVQTVGDTHMWTWNMIEGSLLKDGSTELVPGGWSITIERYN
jgi:hypothetical protein